MNEIIIKGRKKLYNIYIYNPNKKKNLLDYLKKQNIVGIEKKNNFSVKRCIIYFKFLIVYNISQWFCHLF